MAGETLSSEEEPVPKLPPLDLVVDFGKPASGVAEPMPPERRAWYQQRIVNASKLTVGFRLTDPSIRPLGTNSNQ